MDDYFPELPQNAIFNMEIILRRTAEDPNYLEDCPLTDTEIEAIQRMLGLVKLDQGIDQFSVDDLGEDTWGTLEDQTQKLFRSLLAEQKNLNVKDNAEKMAFFRTATSLLDKLVGIRERAANLKQISVFYDTIMQIMDDVLEAGQRTEVMDRLRKASNQEASE